MIGLVITGGVVHVFPANDRRAYLFASIIGSTGKRVCQPLATDEEWESIRDNLPENVIVVDYRDHK